MPAGNPRLFPPGADPTGGITSFPQTQLPDQLFNARCR